jgi:hypothetical protein
MVILEVATGQRLSVAIAPVDSKDFKLITKKRYFFDWKRERGITEIFKLTVEGIPDILGLASIIDFPTECRLQIHLICASLENVGKVKKYQGIIGCLIGHVGQIALQRYSEAACVSLLPKTELRAYYKREYGMVDGGPQVFLIGTRLLAVVNKYL